MKNLQGKIQTKKDQHKGLHHYLFETIDPSQFQSYLRQCISQQKQLSSVWVHFQASNVLILDLLVNKLNYNIHHAVGKEIVVYQWLRKDEDLVVPYSIFWNAAGAVVIKDNKILLVQQKNGARKGKYGLPGGRANRNEFIGHCAERELLEQTGIKASFSRILFFRESIKNQVYNCVDIYYVCLMDLNQNSFDNFELCQRQISAFAWIELSEYQEFCRKYSVGTQLVVSQHIANLHRWGKLLCKNEYQTEMNQERGLCLHRL